jgi:hypothetical protein
MLLGQKTKKNKIKECRKLHENIKGELFLRRYRRRSKDNIKADFKERICNAFSLVNTTEELLERENSSLILENR